jgi:hypothetical protein
MAQRINRAVAEDDLTLNAGPTAPCVVQCLPRQALVDRATRAKGLAVLDVPSARASGARADPA